MSLDLEFDDAQAALADALAHFCGERCGEAALRAADGGLDRTLWSELAALGVLAAGAPAGEGGALEICAAMEALGRAAFPGPLVGTFVAMQVLDGRERDAVAEGRAIVSCGEPPLMPFAPVADVFVEIAGEALHRGEPAGPVEAVAVLGGEPWGRVALERGPRLEGSARALAIGEIALAAQLAALGARLVDAAAEHARTRRQFGRAIGEFQAVAHPLADCSMRLAAGRTLARAAAWHFDAGEWAAAASRAASARLACAGAAVEAAHVGHQVFGALGITLEGPAFHLSRRIRQLASTPPGADRARQRMLARLGMAA